MTVNWMIPCSWISEEVKTIETEISGVRGWGWGYELRGLQGKFEEWWWWLHNYYFCQNGVFFLKNLCCAKSLQSCPTRCNPMNSNSPQGSSVHGFLQARILEWVPIPFSRGSSRPWDQTRVTCIAGGFFTICATRDALYKLTLSPNTSCLNSTQRARLVINF